MWSRHSLVLAWVVQDLGVARREGCSLGQRHPDPSPELGIPWPAFGIFVFYHWWEMASWMIKSLSVITCPSFLHPVCVYILFYCPKREKHIFLKIFQFEYRSWFDYCLIVESNSRSLKVQLFSLECRTRRYNRESAKTLSILGPCFRRMWDRGRGGWPPFIICILV